MHKFVLFEQFFEDGDDSYEKEYIILSKNNNKLL